MSPSRVRVSMHYMSVPPLQKAEVSGVGAARGVWLLSNRKTERFDCVVGRGVLGGARRRGRAPRLCLSKTLSGLQRSPCPCHRVLYRPYSIREAHHLLRDNPVHLNITSFGFTKPSESKDPSRRLVYLLRSPGGQFPRISPNGVF
jgi:hypothetical protein